MTLNISYSGLDVPTTDFETIATGIEACVLSCKQQRTNEGLFIVEIIALNKTLRFSTTTQLTPGQTVTCDVARTQDGLLYLAQNVTT